MRGGTVGQGAAILPTASAREDVTRINFVLAAGHLAINFYQFFALPLLLLPASPWWALTLIPLAATSNPLWSLLHETIHSSFHPSTRVNRRAGRCLAIAFGSPWRVLSVGHLLHHRFNRTKQERPELFDPARTTRAAAAFPYYGQLLIGLYLSQILSPIAFFLPRRVLDRARRRFLDPQSYQGHAAAALTRDGALREIRRDGLLIYAALAASAVAYGPYWWMVLAILAARGVAISFLDYIYHYGTGIDRPLHARNLRASPPLATLLLNFNLHGIHHRHPRLPWRALPDAFRNERGSYDGDYLVAALRQLRGPIPIGAVSPTAAGAPVSRQ
jgi:fatty acid desaturase